MKKRRSLLVFVLCLLLPLSALASPGTPCPEAAHAEQVADDASQHHGVHHGTPPNSASVDHAAHTSHVPTAQIDSDETPCDCCKVCADRCAALGSLTWVSSLGLSTLSVAPYRIGFSAGGALTEDPDPHGLFRPPIFSA